MKKTVTTKKKYAIVLPRRKVNKYFELLDIIDGIYMDMVDSLEIKMAATTKVPDIEFIWNDGIIIGIGNMERTMKLIHR